MGVKLWMHLDSRERSVLTTCVPSLYKRAMSDLRQHHSTQQAEAEEITRRIAELKEKVATLHAQIAELHARAKAHDVPHDTPELVDSTMPLQNELSLILKAMVAAQSELKMLEQNRMLLQQPNQEDWFSPVVARCTAQLVPALQSLRRMLDEHSAWALLEELWAEELRGVADQTWDAIVEALVHDLERAWIAQTESRASALDHTAPAVVQVR